MEIPTKFTVFSGSLLKLLAVITMLIDHGTLILAREVEWMGLAFSLGGKSVTVYYILRRIGRLAFPLFCFLLVEGFLHTRNRKRYAAGLLIFALLSEIPWNYMVGGRYIYPAKQNVYFTLFLGVLLLCILAWETADWKKWLCLFGLYALTRILSADYGMNGVLLIGLLYVLRAQKTARMLLALPLLSGGWAAFCAFIPINMYNGQRGFIKGRGLKYAFYLFYPLHITVLLLIKYALR